MTCDKRGCEAEATHEVVFMLSGIRTCLEHLDSASRIQGVCWVRTLKPESASA